MSTEIYPPLEQSQIEQISKESRLLEQRWLIDSIIKPDLDDVLDALTTCLDMLTSNDAVLLPVSSSRTEQVKGTLTRQSTEVSDIDVALHFTTFSKKVHLKLKESAHLEMEQLSSLLSLINDTMTGVVLLKDHDKDDCDGFSRKLEKILSNLAKCNAALNKPPEKVLFPMHRLDITEIFVPDEKKLEHYKDRIAIDFFVLNGEVSLEIKSLHIVTEEPWCHVDPITGKSHVDKLRDDLKHKRVKITDILEPEGTYKRGITHVLGINKFTPHDYLTRGVTYNGKVVIEVEKTVVYCQDPSLLSIGAKLNGLEHLVSKMYSNLDMSMM